MTHTSSRRRLLGALVAVLSCAGLLAAAPAPAPAVGDDASARLISPQLGPLPEVVAHRRVLTLRLTGTLPNAAVEFFRTPAGGTEQSLGTTTADMAGEATLTVAAQSNAAYRGATDFGGGPIYTDSRAVAVTRRVGFARVVTDAARRTVRFTMTVSTGAAPGTLVLQRRRGDRWVAVDTWPARARLVQTLVVPRGRTVHRAVVKATTSYRTSVSRTVVVNLG